MLACTFLQNTITMANKLSICLIFESDLSGMSAIHSLYYVCNTGSCIQHLLCCLCPHWCCLQKIAPDRWYQICPIPAPLLAPCCQAFTFYFFSREENKMPHMMMLFLKRSKKMNGQKKYKVWYKKLYVTHHNKRYRMSVRLILRYWAK